METAGCGISVEQTVTLPMTHRSFAAAKHQIYGTNFIDLPSLVMCPLWITPCLSSRRLSGVRYTDKNKIKTAIKQSLVNLEPNFILNRGPKFRTRLEDVIKNKAAILSEDLQSIHVNICAKFQVNVSPPPPHCDNVSRWICTSLSHYIVVAL